MDLFRELEVRREGRVVVATLNRPETRNAITGKEMVDELCQLCEWVNSDPEVSVVVLTGADPAFSSGGNVKDMKEKRGMFSGTLSEIVDGYKSHVQRIPLALESIEVPLIAAVNGPAVGAGFDLTLMCDIRIASEKARFGETFLQVGLIPGDGGAWLLPRAVGMSKACEMTFASEVLDAEQALAAGLVSKVVPHDRLMEEALALAGRIAEKPPRALRMSKKLLKMGARMALPDFLEQCAYMQSHCHGSEDHHEALAAMAERRKPQFKGR